MIELFRNLLCVVGGVALGYYLAHVRLEAKYLERADQESEESKRYYREKYERLIADDVETVTEAAEAMAKYEAAKKNVEEIEALTNPVVKKKLIDVALDEKIQEAKDNRPNDPQEAINAGYAPSAKARVTTDKVGPLRMNYNHISTPPKVTEASEEAEVSEEDELQIEFITKQDFFEDQFGYKQIMLTYWAGDDILSNEKEQPILGSAREVSLGQEALTKLKAGGEDVIFVRNRSGKWEFEITRTQEKYEEVVGPITITEDVPQIDAME